MTDVSVSLRAKRKRGRPRKESNLYRDGSSLQSPEHSSLMKTQLVDKNPEDGTGSVDSSMVGSVVYGVIEGSFDAGYLISVRIGNNHSPFRGVVFQPKRIVPVSAANDIAPQVKMYDRRAIPVTVYDDLNQTSSDFSPHSQPERASKQAVFRPPVLASVPVSSSNHESVMMMMRTTSSCSDMGSGKIVVPKACKQFSYHVDPSGTSLRMVEEDEVMQAFEVSTSSGGCKNKVATSGDMISEPLSKATNSFPGTECINQKAGSNVQLHHNLMETKRPQSTFEIQQDEMIEQSRNLLHPTIELLAAQTHSVPRESQQKTEVQPMYFNELMTSPDVSFHQNLFTNQSQPDSQEPISLAAAQFHTGDFVDSVSRSPNLKLDLAFTAHENKQLPTEPRATSETNYGYHQALVAGNPLLLPPDLMSEPLELMMERPKSSPNCRTPLETNLEEESRAVEAASERFVGENAASPRASYKLELATPQSALSTRPAIETNSSRGCITDMDFVLNDAIRPAESHHHQSDPSETTQR